MDLMTDLIAIPQKHSDVLVDAWSSHNRQLAERWSQALKKACAEKKRDHFSAALKEAWASDPELRAKFGQAVSAGLRRMWANSLRRAEQSERVRRAYTPNLRRRRSEKLREMWANAGFREKMKRAREGKSREAV